MKIKTPNRILKNKKAKGFTLFLALIVSSLVLAIGVSMGTIILKQLIFSNSGRESQLAFYAADSGAECAVYWHRKDINGALAESVFSTSSPAFSEIFCGTGKSGFPAQVGSFEKNSTLSGATTTFYVNFSNTTIDPEDKACAKVTVSYWYDDVSQSDRARIDSRGYNVDMDGGGFGPSVPSGSGAICNFTNGNRIVERAIQLDF
ncbi:MAG: hypothetical protein QG568_785 [Patescibacteria group bacterium]|nr:hypothetical protein [Patescibacteria group bacterium]